MIGLRGLGAGYVGSTVDCTAWSALITPACYTNPCNFGIFAPKSCIPSPPAPVAAAAPQTQTQLTQPGAWTPDQAIAATAAAQKQQNINFFQSLGGGGGTPSPSDQPDCTNWWTYYTNSACPPDCSRFWTNLLNSACPGFGTNSLVMPLAIAAGVLLLVVVIRR